MQENTRGADRVHRFIAQTTGTLVVANYQVLLYNNLGLYGSLPLLLYSLYLSWASFMNWVATMIVDRVGRVRMLAIGFVSLLEGRGEIHTDNTYRLHNHAQLVHGYGCAVRGLYQ